LHSGHGERAAEDAYDRVRQNAREPPFILVRNMY
jgi:hypothetical protein